MLFEEDILILQHIENDRVKVVIQAAIDRATDRIRPSDLLISAIEGKDSQVLVAIDQALNSGCTSLILRDVIEVYNPRRTRATAFDGRKKWFTPEALTALEQFDAELSADTGKLLDVALELLLACVLSHLEVEDIEYLTIFDAERCAASFREQVNRHIEAQPSLFDNLSGQLRFDVFSQNGWACMETAARIAANLGYATILQSLCFLGLLDEKGGIAEHLIRLQISPDIGINQVSIILTRAFRIGPPQPAPIILIRNNIDESFVILLKKSQMVAHLWRANVIQTCHILSALLDEMPPRLAFELQNSPLNLDLEKMRRHLNMIIREENTQITHETALRLPSTLLPSEDLTHLAHIKALPKAIPIHNYDQQKKGRDPVDPYDDITRALHRREKNNILITGLRGVGKTTLVREIARRAAQCEIDFLKHKRFLWVDCQDVSPYESKDKLEALLDFVADKTDLLLCIDGLGPLLCSEPRNDNILLLRKALKEGQLHLIAVLSNHDFDELLSYDYELLEFFTRVNIEGPDKEIALAITKQICSELERTYKVSIEERTIERAVILSDNYLLNEQLPAKAIKILRQACEHLDYERAQLASKRTMVTTSDVISVVAHITGMPKETLSGVTGKVDYEKDLAVMVVGQDEAVKAVAAELRRIKAGWTDPTKPASVMLFAGLTGVGKTELAKVIAKLYSTSKHIQTYTMGNFTEPHSVSGIIGAPPGYIGSDRGGRLINDLNADPYCVFLLDEAEKAHPEVWKPFLNLFDEAWITDTHGTKAFADKAIFILTSNAGSEIISQMWRAGERDMGKITAKVKNVLTKIYHERSHQPVFSPEFLARIRRIIIFKPLDYEAIEGICRKQLAKLQRAWKERHEKTLVISDALIEHIAERSHQENQRSGNKEGGRIVEKLISELIEESIQQEQSKREDDYQNAEIIELIFSKTTSSGRSEQSKITVKFRANQ
ncbi:MAG: AAA family ATPase [Ktedonobacteraceae bacterium]